VRTSFIQELCELAAADERIWLVFGDLGYSVLEAFISRFPDRYLNAGVAEQNMTGIAAGLAMLGKTVFTYTITNFAVMRCLEQIRNDVCYDNLNVKIVSVGGGVAYGSHGYTHHGVEDLAVMSAMPNLAVAAPGDPIEARFITRMMADRPGPGYLRIGKAGEPVLHDPDTNVLWGKAIPVRSNPARQGSALTGSALTLISTGGMLETTLRAADLLAQQGHSADVLSMPFLVPLDEPAIAEAARRTGVIVTVEEHGPGGLGTLVGEALARLGEPVIFTPLRLAREPIRVAGTQQSLRAAQGLDAAGIARSAALAIERRAATVSR
jgi:transketolase